MTSNPFVVWSPRLAVLVGALWLGGGVSADASSPPVKVPTELTCSEEVSARVQTRYDEIEDLRADFQQTTSSRALGEDARARISRGQVVFAKPGRMRWSYEAPERSRVISDGKTLWLHDVDAREVQRLPVTEGYLSGAALEFLFGGGRLDEKFSVSATECGEVAASLELVPREDAGFERFGLRVDPRTGEILESRVVDLFGNVTRIEFTQVRVNTGPPPETFVFEPIPGVEVIDLVTGQ